MKDWDKYTRYMFYILVFMLIFYLVFNIAAIILSDSINTESENVSYNMEVNYCPYCGRYLGDN